MAKNNKEIVFEERSKWRFLDEHIPIFCGCIYGAITCWDVRKAAPENSTEYLLSDLGLMLFVCAFLYGIIRKFPSKD